MKTFKQFLLENLDNSTNNTEIDDPFEGNQQLKALYSGFVGAEHTSEKIEDPYAFNPKLFVRTRAGGGASSAYGPVQMTASTVKGFIKTQPDLFKTIKPYADQFVEQGTKMLKADDKDPKYGLGCVGDLCDEKHNINYQKMATAVIKGKAKEKGIDISKPLSDKDLNTLVSYWRGATEQQDPRYFKAFRESFKIGSQQQKQQQQHQQQPKNTLANPGMVVGGDARSLSMSGELSYPAGKSIYHFEKPVSEKPKEQKENNIEYTVKPGDNLTKIAQANNKNLQDIIKLNNILDPNKISVGQKIKLPK